jgi:septum formation protein
MTSPKAASPTASNSSGNRLRLILASESPRRLNLLKQAGVVPDAVKPAAIDETQERNETPRTYVERLAKEKARAVFEPGAIVVAADTTVVCGRRLLHKAETPEDVRKYLALMSGRRHQVLTGIAALLDDKIRTRIVVTRLSFARLTDEQIESYVQCGEGLGKAGGYAMQGRAETFVKSINGSYSNVVGLPLYETVTLLRGYGYPC